MLSFSSSRFSLLASRFFSILWRISLLILPWQTRWIFEKGMISGFSWEAGTISLYASWIILLLTVLVSLFAFWDRWKSACHCSSCSDWKNGSLLRWIAYLRDAWKAPTLTERIKSCFRHWLTQSVVASLVALVLVLPTIYSVSPKASLLWWMNILILGAFVCVMRIAKVEKASVILWFVISLIPQALLGGYQYLNQDAFGATILGMAPHHPWLAGTSVVEHGLYRVLRAYGGFPHPNILGGWLAAGLTVLPFLIPIQKRSVGRILLYLTGFLFASVLVFTFSRSAWIAAVVGLITATLWLWKSLDEIARLRIISFLIIIVASVGVCAGVYWDHVSARFHPDENRLEAWSIESRSRSMAEGAEAFNQRQITGWGQGTSLIASIVARTKDLKRHPILILVDPEPAHDVPQVILVEMGLFGFLAVLLLAIIAYRFCSRRYRFRLLEKQWTIWIPHPLLFVLVILAALDHYEWTTWAGQSLVAISILMGLGERTERGRGRSF